MKLEKFKKITLQKHFAGISSFIFGGIYAIFLLIINDPTFGDYRFFASEPVSIFYGFTRWQTWSSRLFIENAVNLFSKNLFAWAIITIFLSGLLFWSLSRILKIRRIEQLLIIFGLFMLINPIFLASAGIFATTICYLWPMSLFLFVISTILQPFKNKKAKQVAELLIFPAIIFAICQEQIAVLSTVFFGWIIFNNLIKKHKNKKSIYFLFIVSLAGVINAIFCPGNIARNVAETAQWWPDFANLNLFEKTQIGTTTTFSRLFLAPEILMIVFVILSLFVAYKKRNQLSFSLSFICNILMFSFFLPANNHGSFIALTNPFFKIRDLAIAISPDNLLPNAYSFMIILVFSTILIGTITSITLSLKSVKIAIPILASLAVCLAISFSPTLFASSTRTLFPLIISLIAANYTLISELINSNFKKGEV